mmetsp:Transcript_88500/g.202479  ORF Transcript_88500/g.202479 Transcript_88500/m.202479 type:complete len:107 (+) Transcript_88500:214-534(+)
MKWASNFQKWAKACRRGWRMKSFMGGPGLMGGSEEEGREISEGCTGKMSFPAFTFIAKVRAIFCLRKEHLDFGCAHLSLLSHSSQKCEPQSACAKYYMIIWLCVCL